MSKYFYKLINNAQDLKNLHEEAILNGKLEIGLSKGKMLYAWDEERNTIRVIKTDEAAERTGLTLTQIDQIIATSAEVDFNTPEPKEEIDLLDELLDDAAFQEETVLLVGTPREEVEAEEPETEEVAAEEVAEPVAEPNQELPALEEVDAPERTQGECNSPLKTLVRRIIEALKDYDESL